MIKATSFDKSVYAKVKLVIDIQKCLSNITKDNIDFTFAKLLENKQIIETEIGISILTKCFNDMANFRPKNIETIIDLIILFDKNKTSKSKFDLFSKKVAEIIHTKENLSSSDLFYLKLLLKRAIIKKESIFNEIECLLNLNDERCINTRHSKQYIRNRIKDIIKWFYFDILSNYKNLLCINSLISCVTDEISKFDYIMVNKMMDTGYCLDYIAEIIRNDDIDTFISIVSAKGNEFDFDQSIKSEGYERCDLLLNETSLINYAAFFNSIKIFKYLYLSKADIYDMNKNYSLIDYAICGGSIEIIHILEQNKIDLINGIDTSIRYYQNDIFAWIIDNNSIDYYNNNDKYNYEKDMDYYFDYNFTCFIENSFESKYNCNLNASEFNIMISSNENIESNSKYDYDTIFRAIVESNNILPLFILFTNGMSINVRNESGRTILHYAVLSGNYLLTKLLLSCDTIDLFLHDINSETPFLYSIKYKRERIINEFFIKTNSINSWDEKDYFKIIQYSQINKLNYVISYFQTNWPFDVHNNLFDSLKYLPFSFFSAYSNILDEMFKTKKYEQFFALATYILSEDSVCF